MKRKTLLSIIRIAWIGICALPIQFVLAEISISKHNLTWDQNKVYQTTTDRICVFCHTPHGGRKDSAPLWNRSLPKDLTFKMYNSVTIDTIIPNMPDGVSLACLSCHDGTVAIDTLINRPGSMGYIPQNLRNENISAGYDFRGGPETDDNTMPEDGRVTNIGKDLAVMHPVSMVYPVVNDIINALDDKFNDPGADHIFDNGVKLFGNTDSSAKVQCASCHNPHKTDYIPFLRVSNNGSNLCLTCHIK